MVQNIYNLEYLKSKSKNAQEAHEAIRPTNFNIENAGKKFSTTKIISTYFNQRNS